MLTNIKVRKRGKADGKKRGSEKGAQIFDVGKKSKKTTRQLEINFGTGEPAQVTTKPLFQQGKKKD